MKLTWEEIVAELRSRPGAEKRMNEMKARLRKRMELDKAVLERLADGPKSHD